MKFPENKKLESGLSQLNLTLSPEQQSKLIAYLHLLQKWNKAYNLTAITEFDQMISHHLLDSLSIAPYITGNDIVDVGSGAGLPGIPLAILFPEKKFTLIDSIGKKTRFITQATRELEIKNVEVVQTRAEEYSKKHEFDTMIARAVGSADQLIVIARALLQQQGQLLMMKSHSEVVSLPHQLIALKVPYLDAKRSLMIVQGESLWQK